jgi:hypothetical protein
VHVIEIMYCKPHACQLLDEITKQQCTKTKVKFSTSITYYWYGLEEEETIRGKWNATLLLTSIVHYNYLPLPHPWTIKIALYVISYQPKATRGLIRAADQSSTCSLQIIDRPTQSNNSFSMFSGRPSFWPTFGGAN